MMPHAGRTIIAAIVTFSVFANLVFAEQTPSPGNPTNFDVIIKGGAVYDGTGAEAKHADVAIRGDRIAGIGDFGAAHAKTVIDANGLAVAPEGVFLKSSTHPRAYGNAG